MFLSSENDDAFAAVREADVIRLSYGDFPLPNVCDDSAADARDIYSYEQVNTDGISVCMCGLRKRFGDCYVSSSGTSPPEQAFVCHLCSCRQITEPRNCLKHTDYTTCTSSVNTQLSGVANGSPERCCRNLHVIQNCDLPLKRICDSDSVTMSARSAEAKRVGSGVRRVLTWLTVPLLFCVFLTGSVR